MIADTPEMRASRVRRHARQTSMQVSQLSEIRNKYQEGLEVFELTVIYECKRDFLFSILHQVSLTSCVILLVLAIGKQINADQAEGRVLLPLLLCPILVELARVFNRTKAKHSVEVLVRVCQFSILMSCLVVLTMFQGYLIRNNQDIGTALIVAGILGFLNSVFFLNRLDKTFDPVSHFSIYVITLLNSYFHPIIIFQAAIFSYYLKQRPSDGRIYFSQKFYLLSIPSILVAFCYCYSTVALLIRAFDLKHSTEAASKRYTMASWGWFMSRAVRMARNIVTWVFVHLNSEKGTPFDFSLKQGLLILGVFLFAIAVDWLLKGFTVNFLSSLFVFGECRRKKFFDNSRSLSNQLEIGQQQEQDEESQEESREPQSDINANQLENTRAPRGSPIYPRNTRRVESTRELLQRTAANSDIQVKVPKKSEFVNNNAEEDLPEALRSQVSFKAEENSESRDEDPQASPENFTKALKSAIKKIDEIKIRKDVDNNGDEEFDESDEPEEFNFVARRNSERFIPLSQLDLKEMLRVKLDKDDQFLEEMIQNTPKIKINKLQLNDYDDLRKKLTIVAPNYLKLIPVTAKKRKVILPVDLEEYNSSKLQYDIVSPGKIMEKKLQRDKQAFEMSDFSKMDLTHKMYELLNENQQKNERMCECLICATNPANIVVQPCGHCHLCYECFKDMALKGSVDCVYCRGPVNKVYTIDVGKTYKNVFQIMDCFKIYTE